MAVSENEFKKQLQDGRMIEDESEMTEGYKEALKHTLLISGDTEFLGASAFYDQIHNTPSLDTRVAEVSIMQDEIGHGYIDYRLLDDLGEDMQELIYGRDEHEFRNPYGFEFEPQSFIEVAVAHAFTDRAGAILLGDIHENTSYAPWKRSLVKINKEEQFHLRYGETWMRRLANREVSVRREVQDAVSWYFPLTAEWFGLPDEEKSRNEQLEFRIKGKTNDELRQEWLGHIVPLCESLDLEVPAYYDEPEDKYVLEYDFPVACDEENREWLLDESISGREMMARWKEGGPDREKIVERIQSNELPVPQ